MCGCIRAIAICSLVFQITTVAQLAVPTYSPGSGLYANTQVVTITSSTRGATIRFTTDGSAPTPTNGTFYAAPLSIATTTTLKAVAYKKGMTQSPVSYASYIINDYVRQAIDVVNKMSLDEKIAQVHGWGNRSIAGSMNAPLYYLTNGPAGVGHAGTNHGGPATALPAPIALAATFDTAMARVFGAIAGGEAHAYSNAMIEAPCVNIARLPQGGRTFEAFGEDPFLSGYIAVANIIGIQEQGISAESKHFACNNQETNRRFINTIVDERTLREIYLPAFEAAVKQGKVDAVMSAYNIVNASFCSENMILLHDILRGEWGFDGYVTSDFGAVQSTIPSAMAGTDVEMQKGKYYSDSLREAVNSGRVPMKVLDDMLVRRISKMMYRGVFHQPLPNEPIPSQAHGALARRIAAAGMVLLKNAKGLLPLTASQVKSIALIGRYAADAMTGGGGSSAVTPSYIVTPLTGIQKKVRSGVSVQLNDGSDITAAAALARRVDVAIVMVGDSLREGRDFSISLSGNQDTLVRAVANANPRTVVVLKTGTAALMPWINNVSAVLEAWYPGEEDGNAVADVLFGDVNPSGKLPLTFPENELDLPAQVVKDSTTNYREGVFVGYRYFDASNKTPLFPFGHGLSYTTFQYHNLSLGPVGAGFDANPHQKVSVELDVTNSGAVAGSEAVQIYVGMPSATVLQPPKQLKGVQKIQLTPGQTGHIRLKLDFRSFAYWDTTRHDWSVAPGNYQILVGSSSRDIRLQGQIKIPGSR